MLSLKKFKKVSINNEYLPTLLGGACTGGGFTLLGTEYQTISLPSGGVDVQRRHRYKTWTSDDNTNGHVTLYGEDLTYSDWY